MTDADLDHEATLLVSQLHHQAPELWMSDDPMPSCDPCEREQHDLCRDLIETYPYGVHACGCLDCEMNQPT